LGLPPMLRAGALVDRVLRFIDSYALQAVLELQEFIPSGPSGLKRTAATGTAS
jgi:hypothetical protein